ncbi:peptidase c13 family domain-containing protein [Ditylenchus destructor]|uniref:legumain n=1 Tax=Ditylenchus destructor TaxID=166010 RepID=A0AAD4MTS2_9BILA|nr:peptidase c13 family domain-containing protein [Ditylenchus destructor]
MSSTSKALLICLLVCWIGSSLSLNFDGSGDGHKIWALLAAGSNTYGNYRHQADVAHAYHMLRNHGIPAENIITMMYDDIANNSENPFPGKIFNSPKGKDVYKGVKIDYKEKDVTPENFLAVLSGNKTGVVGGNGRVIESSKRDKIFVFFSDHGATGLVGFPSSELTVQQLMDTLKQMHKKHRYAELTFYLEACESGSMFENVLPKDINVYAVSAANSEESSWGAYCRLKIDGKDMPCLGDHFSVNYLEDSDKSDLNKETLKDQYEKVKKQTNDSHVCHFGSDKIMNEHLSEFQGSKPAESNGNGDNSDNYVKWPSRDIPILQLMAQRDRESDPSVKAKLDGQINLMQQKRRYLEAQILAIVKKLVADESGRKRAMEARPERLHEILDCHNDVVKAFSRKCFNLGTNSYALKYVYVLANLCEMRLETDEIVNALEEHCKSLPANVGGIVMSSKALLSCFLVCWIGSSLSLDSDNSDDDGRKIWALLVAGSYSWVNYRHQADVAHAYQVVRNHGIPAENIVTMMFDDIAYHKENPFPGKIFNHPNATDVYHGVKVDYRENDVTPENFIAVLSGNKSGVVGGNGRVIESTKNDKIFVYLSDHGGAGVVCFPQKDLTVKQLNDGLREMYKNNRYGEITFYLEACESGSMFDKVLPKDINVYAVTAAAFNEDSWAMYCYYSIQGKDMPCLGDKNLNKETLKEQYEVAKNLTVLSSVCRYGSETIWKEHVSEFQGKHQTQNNAEKDNSDNFVKWPSRDIPILQLMAQRDRESDPSVKAKLDDQINLMQQKRRYLEAQILAIVQKLVADESGRKRAMEARPERLHEILDCHNDVVKAFSRKCFNLGTNSYALKYVYVLANLCEMRLETDEIVNGLENHCKSLPANVGGIVLDEKYIRIRRWVKSTKLSRIAGYRRKNCEDPPPRPRNKARIKQLQSEKHNIHRRGPSHGNPTKSPKSAECTVGKCGGNEPASENKNTKCGRVSCRQYGNSGHKTSPPIQSNEQNGNKKQKFRYNRFTRVARVYPWIKGRPTVARPAHFSQCFLRSCRTDSTCRTQNIEHRARRGVLSGCTQCIKVKSKRKCVPAPDRESIEKWKKDIKSKHDEYLDKYYLHIPLDEDSDGKPTDISWDKSHHKGILEYKLMQDDDENGGRPYFLLSWIHTNNAYQKQGVARALMEKWIEDTVMKDPRKVKEVKLSVLRGRDNAEANYLYRRLGFKWDDSRDKADWEMTLKTRNYKRYHNIKYKTAKPRIWQLS